MTAGRRVLTAFAAAVLTVTGLQGAATAAGPEAPLVVSERAAAPGGSGGRLDIPSIGKRGVRVKSVGTRGGEVAVPGDVRTVGWWTGSQPFVSNKGSSIVAGHVSDNHDSPGALYRLASMKVGQKIVWRKGGKKKVFKVTKKTFTDRTGKLPERIWSEKGPRTINLVSCANKVVYSSGYYHYTKNVTVTAQLVKPKSKQKDKKAER